jgi:cyclic pyranopterin monophosphate synthase
MTELPHLDDEGAARMVDVGAKEATERYARAEAVVRMSPETARAVARGDSRKGDVVGTARLAGIQAAKRTDELIPLAHPVALTYVGVEVQIDEEAGLIGLTSDARTVGQTGVEMEAMTACAVAALTVYDMVKGVERGVAIERIVLLEKSGGRSGEWRSEAGSGDHTSAGG